MNIKELLKAIYENPINISIEYSNINGQEQLKINGQDIKELTSKTSRSEATVKKINDFKNKIDNLPDCFFNQVLEIIEKDIDLKEFDELLSQEEFTKEETKLVDSHITYVSNVIKELIENKINRLTEVYNTFSE